MGFKCKDLCKGKLKWVWVIGAVAVALIAIIAVVFSMGGDKNKPVLPPMKCNKLTTDSTMEAVKKHKKCQAEYEKKLKAYNKDMKEYLKERKEADKYIAATLSK